MRESERERRDLCEPMWRKWAPGGRRIVDCWLSEGSCRGDFTYRSGIVSSLRVERVIKAIVILRR